MENWAEELKMFNQINGGEKMKHTPGPWSTPCNTNGEAVQLSIMYGGEYGQHIATVCGPGAGATRESMRANARLISACPELLEACKLILSWIECLGSESGGSFDPNEPADILRKAIAKAEGKP